MKAKKAYLGVAGILIAGLILGISLGRNFNQQKELPELSLLFKEEKPQILKEKPAQEEKLTQKSAPQKIAQKKERPEVIKLSQGQKEEEPLFIQRLKAARIEVKGYKQMDGLSKLVSEHYKKQGYPPLEREFKDVKDDKKVKPGEVLVKRVLFNDDGSYSVSYYKVKVKQGEEQEATDILRDDPEVYSAEQNVLIRAKLSVPLRLGVIEPPGSTIQYDPRFDKQWGLKKIEAERTWEIEKGNKSVKIAIIDSGVDMEHPDLKDNINKELSYDYINDDDDPSDEEELSHGTHVAGIIAGVGGNGIGVHGVMWYADIIVEKIFTQAVQDIAADVIANVITDAIDKGAKVINMSWGTQADLMQESETLKDAFEAAFSSDVILVAAAGNHKDVAYPAKYEEVIAVGGTDEEDKRWVDEVKDYTASPDTNPYYGQPYESAYGEKVDVSAPAKDIYSTITSPKPGEEAYAYLSGTSMASAFVSGLAGLLLAYKPDLSKEELIKAIKENVDEVNTEGDKSLGGRINAKKALEAIGGETSSEGKELKAVAYVGEKEKKEIEVNVGEEVQFYGDDSQAPEGYQLSDLRFQWDFGDGETSDEMNPKHKYNKEGKYIPILVISLGETLDSDYVTVKVGEETDNKIHITGRVTKEGKPQRGVTVEMRLKDKDGQEVSRVSKQTDENGNYEIVFEVADSSAEYSVDLLKPKYEENILTGLKAGDSKTYAIELNSGGVSIPRGEGEAGDNGGGEKRGGRTKEDICQDLWVFYYSQTYYQGQGRKHAVGKCKEAWKQAQELGCDWTKSKSADKCGTEQDEFCGEKNKPACPSGKLACDQLSGEWKCVNGGEGDGDTPSHPSPEIPGPGF